MYKAMSYTLDTTISNFIQGMLGKKTSFLFTKLMSQLAQIRCTLHNQNICRYTNVLIWKSTPVIFVNRKLVFHSLGLFIFIEQSLNENAHGDT